MRMLLPVLAAALTLPGAQVPRPSPEMSWYSFDGQKIQLSHYRGKVVAIEMLSTTCPHCQYTARVLARMQTEFGPRGFQVLGMAINDDANVAEFVQAFRTNFPIGKGRRDDALGFLQHSVMSPLYYPGVVLIDQKGIIQGQYSGSDAFLSETNQEGNFRAEIQKLLGAGGAKPTGSPAARKKAS